MVTPLVPPLAAGEALHCTGQAVIRLLSAWTVEVVLSC